MSLLEEITSRLQYLSPTLLEISDDSAMHVGHKGNGGGGHFSLKIASSQFCNKSQIMRHRLIYQALADLIPQQIHALSIDAQATENAE
jgi:BolA protein